MRNKLFVGLIAVAALLAGLVVIDSPSSQRKDPDVLGHSITLNGQPVELKSFSTCPPGQGCIYTDHNGTGTILNVVFSQVRDNCINMGAGMNDKMSSSIETIGSGWHFKFYSNANCHDYEVLSNWTQPDDTSAEWFGSKEDTMSSFKLVL